MSKRTSESVRPAETVGAVTTASKYTITAQADEYRPATHDYFRQHFENFVFQGGGMRGIAFGGAILFLEKYNLLSQIKRFAGSSAGAIVAGLLAVGCTGQKTTDILHNTRFHTFMDGRESPLYAFSDAWRFLHEYGFFKGEVFEQWYGKVLEDITGDPNITFLQVYERYGKELVITGTCLNTCETHYYHYKEYPHMPVKTAVRISMGIPCIFTAFKEPGTDNLMVDGGILNNYPIWVFDGKTIGDPGVTDEEILKSKTLGFKLMTDQEKQDYKLYHIEERIDGAMGFIKALINSMLIQIERGHIRAGYWPRTVCINTHNADSFNFDLPDETKQKLIQSGYDSISAKMIEISNTLVPKPVETTQTTQTTETDEITIEDITNSIEHLSF